MAPRFPLLLLLLPLALPPVSGSCGGGGSQVPDGAPVITAVSPGAFAGYPARMVTFRATASNNPISWDWSFGGGAVPNTDSAAEPRVMLGESGTYTGHVRASNNQGTGQTFRFTYTVEVPIQATFTDIHITDAPEPVAFEAVQLGTKLAVAYRTGDEVRVARATKAVPTGPADWVEHKVDDADGGGVPGVVATPERLYVAYFRQRRMVVATSIGQEPSSAADYGVGIVQAGETGSGMAMLIRGTTPYVGYVDGGGRAMMGPATGLIGNEWTIAVDPGGEGLRVAQDAQGLWAAWFNRTRGEVVVARQRNGQWSHHRIAGAAEGVALQRVRDRLYLLTGEGSAGQMRVLISKGPDPQSAEDYTELLLVGRNFAGPASLGVVEGRLAFALMDPAGRMNIARSLKVTPLHSSDFAFVALDPGDEASVLQLNERVVFVYSGLDQKSLTAELGSGSW